MTLERVRDLWRDLGNAPHVFTVPVAVVGSDDEHRVAPPGWIGIVTLLSDVVIACPSMELDRMREATRGQRLR